MAEMVETFTYNDHHVEVYRYAAGTLALTPAERSEYFSPPDYSVDAMKLAQGLGNSFPADHVGERIQHEWLARQIASSPGTHYAAFASDNMGDVDACGYTEQDPSIPKALFVVNALEVPQVRIGTPLGRLAASGVLLAMLTHQPDTTRVIFTLRTRRPETRHDYFRLIGVDIPAEGEGGQEVRLAFATAGIIRAGIADLVGIERLFEAPPQRAPWWHWPRKPLTHGQ